MGQNMQNVTTIGNGNGAKVFELPKIQSTELPDEDNAEEKKQSWLVKRAADIGVIDTMANPAPPKGWTINPSNITVLITILLFIGGLYKFTADTNYQKGLDDAEKKSILERLDNAEKEVKKAKDLQLYNQSAAEEKQKETKPKSGK